MQNEQIDFRDLQSILKDTLNGDLKDVAIVLNDLRKTVEFAKEFEGQPIYINKGISRQLRYIELVVDYQVFEKDYGRSQALRKVARMYNYSVYWVKKILENTKINKKVG